MQAGATGGAVEVARAALAAGGPSALYSGWLSTLLRNAPSNVISFTAFEALRAAQLGPAESGAAHEQRALGPARSVATGAHPRPGFRRRRACERRTNAARHIPHCLSQD